MLNLIGNLVAQALRAKATLNNLNKPQSKDANPDLSRLNPQKQLPTAREKSTSPLSRCAEKKEKYLQAVRHIQTHRNAAKEHMHKVVFAASLLSSAASSYSGHPQVLVQTVALAIVINKLTNPSKV